MHGIYNVKKNIHFVLRYFLQIAASLITYVNKLQILQYKCNFFSIKIHSLSSMFVTKFALNNLSFKFKQTL